MKRIDDHSVELSEAEMVVSEIMDVLLDQGMCPGCALIMIRGAEVEDGVRSPTPTLDSVLSVEFSAYLTE
jgi:hypothetical protein